MQRLSARRLVLTALLVAIAVVWVGVQAGSPAQAAGAVLAGSVVIAFLLTRAWRVRSAGGERADQ